MIVTSKLVEFSRDNLTSVQASFQAVLVSKFFSKLSKHLSIYIISIAISCLYVLFVILKFVSTKTSLEQNFKDIYTKVTLM